MQANPSCADQFMNVRVFYLQLPYYHILIHVQVYRSSSSTTRGHYSFLRIMDATSPHDGRIPHTCSYCQEELVEPKSKPAWRAELGRYDTDFTFKTDGIRAQEAAANGCAFWDWFIKDFIDEDGTIRRNAKIDVDGVYFKATFTHYDDERGYNEYPFPLRSAYMGRYHKTGSSNHGSLNIAANEGIRSLSSIVTFCA